MKTHFPNLRRWMTLSAVAGPALWFVAFLAFAGGAGIWAMLAVGAGIAAMLAFPVFAMKASGTPKREESVFEKVAVRGAIGLAIVWLMFTPEWQPVIDHLLSGGGLWDWKPIAAVALLLLGLASRNCRAVRELDDREIFAFYQGEPCR